MNTWLPNFNRFGDGFSLSSGAEMFWSSSALSSNPNGWYTLSGAYGDLPNMIEETTALWLGETQRIGGVNALRKG